MKFIDMFICEVDDSFDWRMRNLLGFSFNILEESPLYFRTFSIINRSYYRYLNISLFICSRMITIDLRLNKLPYRNFPEYKEYKKKEK